MRLSDEQALVVSSDSNDLIVIAAAGSGKTRVIVERYVRLVREGISPGQILTITFTRKAAAEMRRRIIERLQDLEMLAEAQACETGPIQTIHSFCERMLREHSFFGGLDPKFQITEGVKSRARFDEALKSVLEREIDERPDWAEFIRLRSGKAVYMSQTSLTNSLKKDIDAVLAQVRGSHWGAQEFALAHRDPETVMEHWKQSLLVEARVVAPVQLPMTAFVRQVKELCRLERRVPSWASSSVDDEIEFTAARDACVLGQMASAVWAELESRMLQEQSFDFSLLESLAVRLLRENPEAAEEVRSQYRVVMVDEAQDLNPTQYRLIEAISADQVVMVGDPQQSIYCFRLADRELLVARTRRQAPLELSQNHRSGRGILSFVDLVFGGLWDGYRAMLPSPTTLDEGRVPMEGVELWPCEAGDHATVAANIQALIEEGVEPEDIAVLARGHSYADKVKESLQLLGVPCLLVAGNQSFYTRMEVHDLANALEALADPNDTLALASLLRGPFVGLGTDALFDIALDGLSLERLRAYEPSNADDHEKLARFRAWFFDLLAYADRLPAWEVCAKLFAVTPFLVSTVGQPGGRRAYANVRKLLVQATQQPEAGVRDFAEQLRSVLLLRDREAEAPQVDLDSNAVKIMTAHAAKGLEFPVVVLPEFMNLRAKPVTGPVTDPRKHLLVGKVDRKEPVVYRMVKEQHKTREAQEELRLLYVAMTRAEAKLCLCVPLKADNSPAGRAASAVGYPGQLESGLTVRKVAE